VLRRENVDLIFTTSPPVSSHLLGLILKKLTGKPWVIDLRDPWTFEPLNAHLFKEGFRLSLERRLERLCLKNADAVIANTPTSAEVYKAHYPQFAQKISVITNGFDASEIEDARNAIHPIPWKHIDKDMFVISHIGTFCRYWHDDPTPQQLLHAFKNMLDDGVVSTDNCRIVLAGAIHAKIVDQINKLGLQDLIDLPGLISHIDALRLMQRSDLLLVYDPCADGKTYVHSKVYEHIGCCRLSLGMLPDGASRALLEHYGCCLFASPTDTEDIRKALIKAIKQQDLPEIRPDFNQSSYERKQLTSMLANLLDQIVHKSNQR
jgi:glycosyltransferase involved in cell wall biosynthesis